MSGPLRTCGNCEGQGGYEVAYAGRPPPWGDGADDGEWIDCPYCHGSGWEEGEPEQLTQDDLPDDNYFQQIHDSDKAWAERNGGLRERE